MERLGVLADAKPVHVIALAILGFGLYHAVRAVYLIYFSPLAIFPGSPWAALSEYWEAWHNIGNKPGQRGQTLFILEKMHNDPKYGPAIRMGPNEVHIYDPRFYNTIYSLNTTYYKDPLMHKVLGAPSSTLAEGDPVRHRRRRAPLESLFSRQSILKLEPMLMEKIELCCTRFDEKYAVGRPVNIEWALKSLAMDMVSEFCLGRSLGALHDEDFMSGPVQTFRSYLHSLHVIKAFPFVRTLAQSLPLWLAKRVNSTIEKASELEALTLRLIDTFTTAFEAGQRPEFPTVMERLLTPSKSKGFDVPDRDGLRDEILTLISAGNDTTGITSMVGLFNVLHNPQIHERLLTELKTLLPDPNSVAPYVAIEKLPYLTAVVKESLRYASAAASRSPRLVPPGGATLPDGRFLPAGTRVGMSIYHVHYNEQLFPDPRRFAPERWLAEENSGRLGQTDEMNKFMVAFSKGTRGCLGLNLAYMEIYLMIGYLVRRFDFQTDTTPADMVWDDMVVAWFHGEFEARPRRRTA